MTTTKKTAAKKAPATPKTVAKKTTKTRITLDDNVMYVVSKRTKLFLWRPVQVFPTRSLANEYKALYEGLGHESYDMYKVDRVELITTNTNDIKDFLAIP